MNEYLMFRQQMEKKSKILWKKIRPEPSNNTNSR